MTKNADPNKYSYSEYGIGFDTCGTFPLPDGSGLRKNAIIFGVDNTSSVHADNTKKEILILGKGQTDEFDDTTKTAGTYYSTNFIELQDILLKPTLQQKQQLLICQWCKNLSIKTADSEIKPYELCLSNISRDVTIDNMKKTGFYGYVYSFSVDYNYVNISHSHITSIHKYFMKKHSIV